MLIFIINFIKSKEANGYGVTFIEIHFNQDHKDLLKTTKIYLIAQGIEFNLRTLIR